MPYDASAWNKSNAHNVKEKDCSIDVNANLNIVRVQNKFHWKNILFEK